MLTVEVRIAPDDVAKRMDEIRRWLDARGIKPTNLISTGSADETVLLVEFDARSDAEAFASEFSGTLLHGSTPR